MSDIKIVPNKKYRVRLDAKELSLKKGPLFHSNGNMDYLLGQIVSFQEEKIRSFYVVIDNWCIGHHCLEEIDTEPSIEENKEYLKNKENFLKLLKEKQNENSSCYSKNC